MKEWLKNVSLFSLIFSIASIVHVLGVRPYFEGNPWCLLIILLVSGMMYLAANEGL